MGNDCEATINKINQKMNPNNMGNTYIYPNTYYTGANPYMNENISQNNLNGIENGQVPKENANTLQNVDRTNGNENKPLNVGQTNENQNLSGQKTTNNNMKSNNSINNNNNNSAIIESNKGKNINEINNEKMKEEIGNNEALINKYQSLINQLNIEIQKYENLKNQYQNSIIQLKNEIYRNPAYGNYNGINNNQITNYAYPLYPNYIYNGQYITTIDQLNYVMNNSRIQMNNQTISNQNIFNALKQNHYLIGNNNNTNAFEKQIEILKKEINGLIEREILYNNQIELLNTINAQKKQIIENNNKAINDLNNQLTIIKNGNQNHITKQIIRGLRGLDNIGATCYMNATLQCLSNTPELTQYFLEKFKNEYPNDQTKKMSNEYYTVLYNLWDTQSDKKSYSPYSFKNALSQENPLFQGIAANDSKDLIQFLMERFHRELNKSNNQSQNNVILTQIDQLDEQKVFNIFFNDFQRNFNSIISNLFYGILKTKSQCQGCGKIKFNFQIYSFIEFPLQQVNNYCFQRGKMNKASKGNKNPDVDLIDCFAYHCNIELMTGDNRMHCDICHQLCDAYYGNEIYSLPHYLIINLNRGKNAIYECCVNFPEKLNLLNYVVYKDGNTFLKLYAVISHIGPSSMSGHFVAYCKNHNDKKWYKYNDSIVTPCERKEEFRDGMPYILFYKAI